MKRRLALWGAVLAGALALGAALRPGHGPAPAEPARDASVSASDASAPKAPFPGADAAAPGAPASEAERTARLRSLVDAQPAQALALEAEIARMFPEGRLADERALLSMRALVHLGRIVEARDAAARFHRRFPRSAWADEVVRLTGYQPRRYGPGTEPSAVH